MLLWYSYERWDPHRKIQQRKQAGVCGSSKGKAHSVSCMGEWGREAKYLQCTRRKSFPGFQTLSLWGTVQSSSPSLDLAGGPIHKLILYILRTGRVEDTPLASSSEPGPPNLSWLLCWGYKKKETNRAAWPQLHCWFQGTDLPGTVLHFSFISWIVNQFTCWGWCF